MSVGTAPTAKYGLPMFFFFFFWGGEGQAGVIYVQVQVHER